MGDWIKYSNNKVQSFYYNQQNGDFQWTRPAEFQDEGGGARLGPDDTAQADPWNPRVTKGWQVREECETWG